MSRQAGLTSGTRRHFDVAAGILADTAGRVLIAERLGGGPFHGMWEFPGGKIGAGEPAADALQLYLGLSVRVKPGTQIKTESMVGDDNGRMQGS